MKQLVALCDAVTQGDWRQIPKALEPFLANRSLEGAADLRPIHDKQKPGSSSPEASRRPSGLKARALTQSPTWGRGHGFFAASLAASSFWIHSSVLSCLPHAL